MAERAGGAQEGEEATAWWRRGDGAEEGRRKVVGPTPDMRARCHIIKNHHQNYETWVPLGPYRPGSRPSPTSGSSLLEDPPTCQWAQLT
jgi:hypothetical protein